jgi:hypothetical protein
VSIRSPIFGRGSCAFCGGLLDGEPQPATNAATQTSAALEMDLARALKDAVPARVIANLPRELA